MNELMMLVGGMVEVLRPGAEDAEELTIDVDGHSSIRGGSYNRSVSFSSARLRDMRSRAVSPAVSPLR